MENMVVSGNQNRGIRVVNRDMLKYMALFLMGVGHMIVFIGMEYFISLPKPIFILFFYGQFFASPVFFFFISEGFVYTNGFIFYLNIQSIRYLIAEIAALVIITFFYNGKKGHFPRFSKWIFYVFYPVHLLAAYFIKLFLV